jgi:N-acetyl-gamma-glutamyl-phosphate reductase
MPELYRDKIKNAKLIANPGCYPTASILPLLPFLSYIDDNSNIFIDAKSGVSGAGKKLSETTHYVKINENIFSYNALTHRHTPEIKEKIELFANKGFNVVFVPHLLPVTRGMLVSIFVTLNSKVDANKTLKEFYQNEPFVRIKDNPVDIKSVAGTNYCDIFVKQQDNVLFISSAIDNLLKGASSAAVVNANIMQGFEEDLGIPKIAYVP